MNADLVAIVSRWKLKTEPYFRTGQSNDALAVYSTLPSGSRILIAVLHEQHKMSCIDEAIEEFLKETDPQLAAALLEDVSRLVNEIDDIEQFATACLNS